MAELVGNHDENQVNVEVVDSDLGVAHVKVNPVE
jgi:hypothetical protein